MAFSKSAENNVSTANAMNALLHKLNGDLFPEEVRAVAFDILHKQQFNVRLSRFLPPGIKVAHKTGTIGGIRNDCGIITIGRIESCDFDAFHRMGRGVSLESAGHASSACLRGGDGDGQDRASGLR